MAKKRNWDIIKNQKPLETAKGRDVFEEQQLERSQLDQKATMTSRNIINAIICIIVFVLIWVLVSLIQGFMHKGDREWSKSPESTYIKANPHYVAIEDPTACISKEEYEIMVDAHNNYGKVTLEEPVKPAPFPAYEYSQDRGGYIINGDMTTFINTDEYNAQLKAYNDSMFAYREAYVKYKAYERAAIDPATIYQFVDESYISKRDRSDILTVDEYNTLLNKYNKSMSKGKITPDDMDVPFDPFPPKTLYKPNAYFDDAKTQPLTYRNVVDGSVISYVEYDELVNKFEQDLEAYNAAYERHRMVWHSDETVLDLSPNLPKFGISLGVSIVLFAVLYAIFSRSLEVQNMMSDGSDINQYTNDQHVALPEEIQQNYDWFPDVGAHSGVVVSSMLSHMALSNKGLKKVELAKRAKEDVKDENGNIVYYEGEIINDEDGDPITKMVPIIDEEFMDALFDASNLKEESMRKRYDTTRIAYNEDGSNRDKLGKFKTVADLINEDWEFPIYEPQRPAGAYIVDTAPVNTMVLAITRAGKGQTYIEPVIDMWMREKRLHNMVINDPKGELLVKNYVRASVRGMQVVQFNLINDMKTDIYNPLAMAADAAREGDNMKCAMYVENIAEVFFPLDGGEDPVWPNAANNAFKRAAYGLIDYYLEEEKAMRRLAERTRVDDKVLEQRIDQMWGRVTLYNCYQLFVQLSSKKMKNPAVEFANNAKAGKYDDLSDEEYKAEVAKVKQKSKLWEDKQEADLLTLYFSATDVLPQNSMRRLVSNANNALKSMGGAEKMMASVYGIAITAMSFFTDPTISTLTSGTLNQNVDLASISFPRRMGVRFHPDYMSRYHFVGLQCVWNAYEDIDFKKCLGKDFYHEDMVTRQGWARYYFDGKFKTDKAYIKLEVRNPTTDILVRTFYFEFRKGYQTSLDGRVYMKDPVLGDKIVKNGIISELRKFKKKDGSIVFRKAKTTFKQKKILDFTSKDKQEVNTNAIVSTMCKYAEKPKAIFLVTPPHLMKYAKLILILLKQLVDLNFDKSYMTKANQKPLYKTRFMLDELGNLQSEGHGINGFATMLSIGLGQEQQFTLILQTLQQLRDVYGDSVDKIVQGNAQPLDSKVLTPSGFVKMGSIVQGNDVVTPKGRIAKVTGVYPRGMRKVYIIKRQDGAKTRVCNEHLWKVQLSDADFVKWQQIMDKEYVIGKSC